MAEGRRSWILYDGRACGAAGTDEASVFVTCDSEAEARRYAKDFGETACYSYEVRGRELTDERWEWDTDSKGRPL